MIRKFPIKIMGNLRINFFKFLFFCACLHSNILKRNLFFEKSTCILEVKIKKIVSNNAFTFDLKADKIAVKYDFYVLENFWRPICLFPSIIEFYNIPKHQKLSIFFLNCFIRSEMDVIVHIIEQKHPLFHGKQTNWYKKFFKA